MSSIVFVIGQLGLGGSERQLYYLTRYLAENGHKVTIAAWNFSRSEHYVGEFRQLGIPVVSLGKTRSSSVLKLFRLRKLLQHTRPHIVHSFSFFTNFPTWLSTVGNAALPLGSVRGEFRRNRTNIGALGYLSSRWPSWQVFNSLQSKQQASRAWIRPSRTWVVQNGIDLSMFRHAPRRYSPMVKVVGVGSYIQDKRWDRLIWAIASLEDLHPYLGATVVGGGPLWQDLKRMALTAGVSKVVDFPGPHSNVPLLLSMSDIFVHTSETEGCPNAVMEAMASGLPVVAMDAGDIRSLVEHEKTGFVIPQDDEAALISAIARLVRDNDLRLSLGINARAKAESEFGFDKSALQMRKIYEEIHSGWIE